MFIYGSCKYFESGWDLNLTSRLYRDCQDVPISSFLRLLPDVKTMAPDLINSGTPKIKSKNWKIFYILWSYDFSDCLSTKTMAPDLNNSGTPKIKSKNWKILYILWSYDFSDCLSTRPSKNTAKVPPVDTNMKEIWLASVLKGQHN